MAKIMIIDDDVDLLETLTAGLSEPGTTVVTRDTIEGAAAAIASEQPDILLLDVMFPERPSGGFDLAREVRRTGGIDTIPIILLTAINQEFPTDFSSKDIGTDWFPVQDLLEKPVDIAGLKRRVKELLA